MDFSKPNVSFTKETKIADPDVKPQVKTLKFSEEKIKSFLYESNDVESMFCCMLYGFDGTGKSGLTLGYLSDEDIKNGYKTVIIDLDGGNEPLLHYHKARCEKHGKKVRDVFVIKNPISIEVTDDDDVVINYKETFGYIKGIVNYVKNNWKEDKIKYLVFDGLSTALKYAEYQMRIEKNIDDDGGVQMRYWLIRNKLFMELLEQIKSIPISKFFIGHENFVLRDDKENSSVIEKTNAMMHQKIKCVRTELPDKVTFNAVIDKSKYNIQKEGSSIEFAQVTKTGEYTWDTDKVFQNLI